MMGRNFLLSIMVPAILLYAVETRASSEVQKENNTYLAEISELREQVKMLMNRVNELEKRAQAQPRQKQREAPIMASKGSAPVVVAPCQSPPVIQPCQPASVCPPLPPV